MRGNVRVRPITDPFRQFDRILSTSGLGANPARSWTPNPAAPLDVYRHEDHLELRFDLPGVDPSAIALTIEDRELVLSAARSEQIPDDAEVVRSERRHGSVERRLSLGEQLDPDGLRADYRNGVLVVTIPVATKAQPRQVEITIGHDGPALEATEAEAGDADASDAA